MVVAFVEFLEFLFEEAAPRVHVDVLGVGAREGGYGREEGGVYLAGFVGAHVDVAGLRLGLVLLVFGVCLMN